MDPDWLGAMLDRHAAALELYARQWCASPDAEDVVQEAFLKLASLRVPPENPAAWLFRVVRNAAITASVAARRRRRHEASASEGRPWFSSSEGQGTGASSGSAVDPETAAIELAALPLEQREVIVAHLWGGLTFEQIAEVAGSSSSTTHRLYQSGLKTLRERLGVSCRNAAPPPQIIRN
jgi:RNA polymerase sigma-70 factor (ECF subfamily)